jgi:hypothetical protein
MFEFKLPSGKVIKWKQIDINFIILLNKKMEAEKIEYLKDVAQTVENLLIDGEYIDKEFNSLDVIEKDLTILFILSESDDDNYQAQTECKFCGYKNEHIINVKDVINYIMSNFPKTDVEEVIESKDKKYLLKLSNYKYLKRFDYSLENLIDEINIETKDGNQIILKREDIRQEMLKLPLKAGKVLNSYATKWLYTLYKTKHICSNPNCAKQNDIIIDDIAFFLNTLC